MYFAVSNIELEIVKWILYTQFVKLNIFLSHSINWIGCMTSLLNGWAESHAILLAIP